MKRFTKHMASFATRHGGLKGVAMAAMLFSAVSMKAAVGDILAQPTNPVECVQSLTQNSC